MASWNQGRDVVDRLLADTQLERVVADAATEDTLMDTARRHVTSAERCADDDPEGALVLAYDAARKAAGALLAHQGLRSTTRGGHIAVADVVTAQFPNVAGLRSLDRLRRRRNEAEYADPADYARVTADEAKEAVETAGQAIASAEWLPAVPQLGVF